MSRGRDLGPVSLRKMHPVSQYRGKFTVRYSASLLLISKHLYCKNTKLKPSHIKSLTHVREVFENIVVEK